ncbi:deoxyribodipyrimidine photo-lyase [Halieaceae bacterium IMCC14734]|uniref:Deoxyribodipyrimidine photo-lyase n=1 Tax=Candidatus Litorirhabdus singularis TaxID=2518993 RepID=A0ABT3TF11_9GAMM|nr:deoxyribodipyrimidine photo-lyase [Candidatus Litorirhabdus singularis]MCX2980405.1 deoxyribodipyrimidine photo-lyase [Candidatus Litorirhabdus singularis]
MSDAQAPLIVWFRDDLRLMDLPALAAAAASDQPLICCYIYDTESAGLRAPGGASCWWLHHSLLALRAQLQGLGGELILRQGKSVDVLMEIAAQTGANGIVCTRAYEPAQIGLEVELARRADDEGLTCRRYPGQLLFEPEAVATGQGTPFRVFTPFWKACRRLVEPAFPVPAPTTLRFYAGDCTTEPLSSLQLAPQAPDWAQGWESLWQPGTAGAQQRLGEFLRETVEDYAAGRDFPGLGATSRLSAHLHFGEISARSVWHAAQQQARERPELGPQIDKFLAELGWREFNRHLLFHYPQIVSQPFSPRFSAFPWQSHPQALLAWQRGQTGYPIVDAGMRELWQTGVMHNRVRMIVASFLSKHLLIDWRDGEAWFWDTLVDADLANNVGGWQWVAGSGADASPYFRVFNPTLQSAKFDKAGDYVRRWVPELAELPAKYLHEPAEAPPEVLEAAGVELGATYPKPLVEHRFARQRALDAYAALT